MPATYVDQVEKLDIPAMMGAAFKASASQECALYRDEAGWHPAAASDLWPSAHQLVARIKLDRASAKAGARPEFGQALLKMLQRDGHPCEQALWLIAAPTRNGRTRWSTMCPYSNRPAETLYFSMDLQQFVSRQVAGLKYRRAVRKVRNHHARVLAIMRELETDHRRPDIRKPIWMAEALYQKLMDELVEMDCRWMAKALKRPLLDYWDEFDYARAKPERVKIPSTAVVFYVKNGVRQLKARYRKRYGLPASEAA